MSGIVKPLTWLLGIVFIVVGILGFFMDPVLGFFEVDTLHNIIHLASGLLAVAAAATSESYARQYLVIFGLVYALVTIAGFVQKTTVLGLIEINMADNLLHLGISAVCLLVGFSGGSKQTMA